MLSVNLVHSKSVNFTVLFSEHHPSRADLSILVEHNNDPTGMGVVATQCIPYFLYNHLCRSAVCLLSGGSQGWDQDHQTVSTASV